ncbi:MAG: hypothetical protein FWD52_05225 [Candidatus Bathyarchaeota archaeon]|nr:hypothetical protein [Candidatus Termiticorpusculum sp.]
MLGKYENFPVNVHFLKMCSSSLSSRQLQQKLVKTLKDLNRKTFCFEEITIPTIPNCEVIFEFGIAEGECFNFLDNQEVNRVLIMFKTGQVLLDFFCVIRYYRCDLQRKTALKFDYYLFRIVFTVKTAEFRVFHKQGPRYISPEELALMIIGSINKAAAKRVLDGNMQ